MLMRSYRRRHSTQAHEMHDFRSRSTSFSTEGTSSSGSDSLISKKQLVRRSSSASNHSTACLGAELIGSPTSTNGSTTTTATDQDHRRLLQSGSLPALRIAQDDEQDSGESAAKSARSATIPGHGKPPLSPLKRRKRNLPRESLLVKALQSPRKPPAPDSSSDVEQQHSEPSGTNAKKARRRRRSSRRASLQAMGTARLSQEISELLSQGVSSSESSLYSTSNASARVAKRKRLSRSLTLNNKRTNR